MTKLRIKHARHDVRDCDVGHVEMVMDGKDCMCSELDAILAAQAARLLALARMPIEEKVKILIELQKMTAPILRAKGRTVHVWEPTDSTSD